MDKKTHISTRRTSKRGTPKRRIQKRRMSKRRTPQRRTSKRGTPRRGTPKRHIQKRRMSKRRTPQRRTSKRGTPKRRIRKRRMSKRRTPKRVLTGGQPIKNASVFVITKQGGNYRVIMVIENGKQHGFYKINTPGGALNRGETPFTGGKREWNEEVGTQMPTIHDLNNFDLGNSRIFYGFTNDHVRYNKNKVLHNETVGLIFPKLHDLMKAVNRHITPSTIITGGQTYVLRKCFYKSFKYMMDNHLLDKYL